MSIDTVFILVKPQLGENIGLAMRAMLNFGCVELRLVSPRIGWSEAAAIDASAGAAESILSGMVVYDSTSASLSDLDYVLATTVRRRDLSLPVVGGGRAGAELIASQSFAGRRCGILFGCERSGLDNDDLSMVHGIVEYGSIEDFPSLNLSHSVLLFAYELSLAFAKERELPRVRGNDIASLGSVDYFCVRLDELLFERGFYRSVEMRPHIRRNMRIMFQRMAPSEQEVRTWHGIVSCLCRDGKNDGENGGENGGGYDGG